MGLASGRLALAGLAMALSLGVTAGARAQHVVTEAEAAKLTLAALTAPPPPPRPIYRAYVRRAMATRIVYREREHAWARRPWHAAARVSDRHLIRHASVSYARHRHRA